jgi:hypothetical protein
MSGKQKKKPPTKKNATSRKRIKNIQHHHRKATATTHSGFEVILQGCECHNNIYVAYLEYGGQRAGEAAYTKPINQAFNNTVMKAIKNPTPLYEDDCNNDSRSMLEIFPFDFWVDRRETKGIEKAKEAVINKGWSWNAFVWVRPSEDENIEQRSKWTLSEWLNNVKTQLEHFMQWTKKHENVYTAYKYQINIRINVNKGICYLADEVLDKPVVNVMKGSYIFERCEDAAEDIELKDALFGPDVSDEEYANRIRNAWGEDD